MRPALHYQLSARRTSMFARTAQAAPPTSWRISRNTLHRSAPSAVLRLALWIGLQLPICTCARCVDKAIERLTRRPEMA